MKKFLLMIFLALFFSTNAFSENLGHVTAEIKGIKDKPKSTLVCFIFNSKEGFLEELKALKTLDAKVSISNTYCEFDVPINKEYAIAVLQDENGNLTLDKNIFGAPIEGWATSNNITHAFNSPNFDESKVLIKEKTLSITVFMHY